MQNRNVCQNKSKQNNCCNRIAFATLNLNFSDGTRGAAAERVDDASKLLKHTNCINFVRCSETRKTQIIYGKNANANGCRNTFPSLHAIQSAIPGNPIRYTRCSQSLSLQRQHHPRRWCALVRCVMCMLHASPHSAPRAPSHSRSEPRRGEVLIGAWIFSFCLVNEWNGMCGIFQIVLRESEKWQRADNKFTL